jgi:NADH-quinone oxidoreductase subunit F
VAAILPEGLTGTEDLVQYRQRGGYAGLERARSLDPTAVVDLVAAADLRGRGGAGFPTGRKWQLALATPSDVRYLVVNGAEGEPGSFKDRTVMARAPHAVLEGILIAAHALAVREVLVYINNLFDDAIAAVSSALGEAEQAGLTDGVTVKLIPETHVYIAGEETALINVLMGKPAQPWHKPPYPTEAGYQGKPTVVNNVETLAAVPLIVRLGADWFRRERPALFSVSGDVERPGVYELPLGTPLRDLIARAGGPVAGTTLTAVLPGGYSMPPIFPDALDVPLDPDALKARGSGLGASIIVAAGRGRGRRLGLLCPRKLREMPRVCQGYACDGGSPGARADRAADGRRRPGRVGRRAQIPAQGDLLVS